MFTLTNLLGLLSTGIILLGCVPAVVCQEQYPLKQPDQKQPNIIFILTDDQDFHLGSLDYLPFVNEHLTRRGTTFTRHYCTTAVCCPARVSLWTGKAAHNTNITDILPPFGGYPKFISQGYNEHYLPIFLQSVGYSTYYTGKLFNAHSVYNYDAPYPAGWTGTEFLLDPYTYAYLNATFQRNRDAPISYEGQYSTDILAEKALGLIDDGVASKQPFFVGISPIAPHSNIDPSLVTHPEGKNRSVKGFVATPPIPAQRHAHLFADATVPRGRNFNPEQPSGANWIRQQPKLSNENVVYNDDYHRKRLQSLQAVDEMVDAIIKKLSSHGVLDETYIFYTSDNGFHIGNHRLQPGKACGYEEDINVPLIIRGPGIPQDATSNIVTSHQDILPTLLQLAKAPLPDDLDGIAIPLNQETQNKAISTRHEHVTVEYWGFGASEGAFGFFGQNQTFVSNNTYKAIRVVSSEFSLYYSVWCNNERELYDMSHDPEQMHNLLLPSSSAKLISGHSVNQVLLRLDALLFVTKSCKGLTCTQPWKALHPLGNVDSLGDALSSKFDSYYKTQSGRVGFSYCALGYLLDAEGQQFERDGSTYWEQLPWHEWV